MSARRTEAPRKTAITMAVMAPSPRTPAETHTQNKEPTHAHTNTHAGRQTHTHTQE